nr:MAG TPA: hypothetical protein [Caudoviricetes sp.]
MLAIFKILLRIYTYFNVTGSLIFNNSTFLGNIRIYT